MQFVSRMYECTSITVHCILTESAAPAGGVAFGKDNGAPPQAGVKREGESFHSSGGGAKRAKGGGGGGYRGGDSPPPEGETRENLNSPFGPCAKEMWMRFNCRKTCGTCGMPLRELLSLKPRIALNLARLAAKARNSPMLLSLGREATKAARRRGSGKGRGRAGWGAGRGGGG